MADGDSDHSAVIHSLLGLDIGNEGQAPGHHLSRVVQHMIHGLPDCLSSRQLFQSLSSEAVGSQLRVKIRQIIGQVTRGISGFGQQLGNHFKPRLAAFDQMARSNDDAFLNQPCCGGRHGTGRHPTDLRVVRPTGHKTQQLARIVKHRRDQGHIRQVRTAKRWVVGDISVARLDAIPAKDFHSFPHTHTQGTQMHWDMGSACHKFTTRIQKCAGKVQPLADVGGYGGAPQQGTHVVHQTVEPMPQQFWRGRYWGRGG